MAIAEALVKQVLNVAVQHEVTSIREVDVAVGVMRQVVPEALEMAFTAVSQGTAVEGAKLNQVEEVITARCRHCRREFNPEIGMFQCPHCHQADVDIVTGDEIILKSVTCEQEEESDENPSG